MNEAVAERAKIEMEAGRAALQRHQAEAPAAPEPDAEPNVAPHLAAALHVDPPLTYTADELYAVADAEGITGLRAIASTYGVKGRGKDELVREILAAQGTPEAHEPEPVTEPGKDGPAFKDHEAGAELDAPDKPEDDDVDDLLA